MEALICKTKLRAEIKNSKYLETSQVENLTTTRDVFFVTIAERWSIDNSITCKGQERRPWTLEN